MTDTDSPELRAWVDTNGDGEDQLHIRVEVDGTVYDRHDLDLAMLLTNEQYVATVSRAALTLHTLYEREVSAQAAAEAAEADQDGVEAD